MTRTVGTSGRVADGIALALVAGGTATYLWAFAGMRALRDNQITPAPGELLMTRWDLYSRAGRWGMALAAGGVVAGVVAHLVHRSRRPTQPAP